jgi:2-polyprenyl-3-methyl-5-hydroxy-6-metoxy-1,4-benzoquinol methylase
MTPLSPLTRSTNVRLIGEVDVDKIVDEWINVFDIDVKDEFCGLTTIEHFECLDSKLRFFKPDSIAGSGSFYENLQQFDWYYMPKKWEHDVALEDLRAGDRVLEVGCGRGSYVNRLNSSEQCNALGIELNQVAVQEAKSMGRNVNGQSLEEVAASEPGSFDVVCHFQVLEHVIDPLSFLEYCVRCLRPGGRLLVAVPNMGGFVGQASVHLLNQPPHHMGQWYPETIRYLPNILPIRLHRLKFEDLSHYHRMWYTNTKLSQVSLPRIADILVKKTARKIGPQILRFDSIRSLIDGHTQYAAFTKE